MGEKVSKLKAGVLKNAVRTVEFHDENSITPQELIEIFSSFVTYFFEKRKHTYCLRML